MRRETYFHGKFRGLRSDTTLISMPSTIMELSPAFTSAPNVPSMESYLSKWEACDARPKFGHRSLLSYRFSPSLCTRNSTFIALVSQAQLAMLDVGVACAARAGFSRVYIAGEGYQRLHSYI